MNSDSRDRVSPMEPIELLGGCVFDTVNKFFGGSKWWDRRSI